MGDKDTDNLDITDQEREYAQSALAEFNKANYSGCLQYLSKLESRSQDPKVLHNKAVAEFYKNELKKTEQFKKNLANVFAVAKLKPDVIEDVEQCGIFYNQAILLYHQKKYTEALRIVDKIYKFIEPMEENLARKVCLLVIELHICTQQHNKALTLITCIENQFVYDKKDEKDKDKDKSDKDKDKDKKDKVLDPNLEAFKTKLNVYRAKCYFMSHSLKAAKREIKNIAAAEGQNTSTLCLRAHLEYLKGNYKNAIKIFNTSPIDCLNFKDTGESSTVIFYNNMGVIHHAMGKTNLACHYFRQALKEDQAAMNSFPKTDGEVNKPLYTLGGSRYHEIMYNLGIALLHAGQPLQAFDCLIIAVQRYHRNSRLWLRIAECCVQVHKPTNEYDFNINKRQKDIVEQVIGQGKHKKLVLANNLSKDMKYSTESQSYAIPVATLEFASLCLRNAFLLLPSETTTSPVPLLLLPGGVQPPPPPPSPGPAPSAPLLPHEAASLKNSVLVTSAYVALCIGDYVLTLEHARSLLGQPKISGAHRLLGHLYAAQALILMDKLSEATDHLNPDHISDISVMIPNEETNDEDEIPLFIGPEIKWFPQNLGTAHAVLQYNLSVALTIRGELEKATDLLKRIWNTRSSTCKIPIQVVMLFLYIELQLGKDATILAKSLNTNVNVLGHHDVARSFLKQVHSPQR